LYGPIASDPRDAVRRYAISCRKERGAALAQAYVPLAFSPGEAYQFDWSHEIVVLNGVTATVKVAHMRLCHSRMLFTRLSARNAGGDLRVLVCGGRAFTDAARVKRELGALHARFNFTTVIEGGAVGADTLARQWAEEAGVHVEEYQADWATLGPSAGPIRNKQMLDDGQPELVVAFPGGRGTANMKEQAGQAGVRVVEIGE
jgi:hypothetical protein